MEVFTIPLDGLTGKFMSLYLFTDVKNTSEIRKKVMTGELQCCVVKASLVVDSFHVAVAANKAALREHYGRLTTKSLFTEILYAMSSSSNISLSLAKFGIHDDDKNIVVATIHTEDGASLDDRILKQIDGEAIAVSRIGELGDEKLIKKRTKSTTKSSESPVFWIRSSVESVATMSCP